jgi:hypothetical protein
MGAAVAIVFLGGCFFGFSGSETHTTCMPQQEDVPD